MTPYHQEAGLTLYGGDALTTLRQLPEASVHCCTTSPPYWGLRDYHTPPQVWDDPGDCGHTWGTTLPQDSRHRWTPANSGAKQTAAAAYPTSRGRWCQTCGAWQGSLGLEPTPERYVSHLVQVFREVRRVLRPDGTLWLNLGDSYATNPGNGRGGERVDGGTPHRSGRDKTRCGLPAKNLIGMPWRVALALQADGWILRSDIIWHKPNGMPNSQRDRPTTNHEYVFLLAQRARYFYDGEAIKEPSVRPELIGQRRLAGVLGLAGQRRDVGRQHDYCHPSGRTKRSVWTIPTRAYKGPHFSTFPPALVAPMVLAGTSAHGCCAACGSPWRRVVARSPGNYTVADPKAGYTAPGQVPHRRQRVNPRNRHEWGYYAETQTLGWEPTCAHDAPVIPCTVLDPFCGIATVGVVARQLGRHFVGIDLSPESCALAVKALQAAAAPKPRPRPRPERVPPPAWYAAQQALPLEASA